MSGWIQATMQQNTIVKIGYFYRECVFFQICKEREACFDMKARRDPVKIGTDEFGLPKISEEFLFKIIYKDTKKLPL